MRLRSMSLKYKFIITVVCFTMVLVVTFGFIVTERLSQELWKQFYARGEDLIKTLAGRLEEKQQTGSVLEVLDATNALGESVELFRQYLFQGELLYFQMVNVNKGYKYEENPGRVNAGLLLVEPSSSTPFEIRDHFFSPQHGQIVDFKLMLKCGSTLEQVDAQVSLCNEPSYLRLGLSPVQVTQELQQAILLLALVSGGFILVGVLVAFILYKWVLGPVEVLIASVKQFRRDRFARARVHSGDELETLATEFNKMASTLSAHEQNLESINQELYRANQVKSEFLAIMGHELKTPLHAIRGYSQLLLQGVDGPLTLEQAQDLETILGSGNHLLGLIDNILRYSKLEAGEEQLHLEQARADEVVADVLRSVAPLVRGRDLKLVDRSSAVGVEADLTKLKQILINLLSNAIKYTHRGAITVSVGADPGSGEVRFAVADTGPGIAAQDGDRIFEPFTQLDGSNTRESSGIGLGLAIVKKYVEMHGGRVWFEPNPQGGTVFYFSLPATAAQTPNGPANGHHALTLQEEEQSQR